MKVLVVGKGGREHTLVWKLAQSPRVDKLYAAPGNPGIARFAECVDIRVDAPITQPEKLRAEILRLRDFALAQQVDLTVVGADDPLAAGIVDTFRDAGLKIFGPTAAAARLESSKAFAKELMAAIGVPTATHRTFADSAAAAAYVRAQGAPIVVKASGLAAGKGAVVARSLEEALEAVAQIMDQRIFGTSGAEVVVEEFMEGEEASLFALCDGEHYQLLAPAQDHKAIGEGDTGPNTGGMGAYAPAPVMTPALIAQAEEGIIRPVLAEMQRRGCPFEGVLYCGLMLTARGPKVVEFNARFGDPETQVVIPLLQTDLAEVFLAACEHRLDQMPLQMSNQTAVCVVLASGGYPGKVTNGFAIEGLDALAGQTDLLAFHAGTALKDGKLVTAGGRVLGLTALAGDLRGAVARAYEGVDMVHFEGAYCRRDIAYRELARGAKK
ncbi:MAG: phosphoribosylamine--glycine ligase [Candidatus Latescibacteria bacterium]|nr:phosphoribosylamine--glycine ligase [Candidatus Latescibacterota bacterium]